MYLLKYIGSLFLGWSLGSNDSANVFGTAVSSRMVRYRLAVLLTAAFVMLGAVLQGSAGIETLSRDIKARNTEQAADGALDSSSAMKRAVVVSFAAAVAVTIMTVMKIPVSTSQAVVGAIVGVGLVQRNVAFDSLGKVVACWIGTPIGAAIFAFVFFKVFRSIFSRLRLSVFVYDPVMTLLLILCGCYGAYALGANNVANVCAVFVGDGKNMLSSGQAAVFGGISIAAGVLTFSKPVMMTVGRGIVKLDAFTAFVCVLAHAVTVHIYAVIGVPVSTSQAIVGAVLGIGLIKGTHTVNLRMLRKVFSGWAATPFVAAILAAVSFMAVASF